MQNAIFLKSYLLTGLILGTPRLKTNVPYDLPILAVINE